MENNTIEIIREWILKEKSLMVVGSKTSTVVPYDSLDTNQMTLKELSILPKSLNFKENSVEISGPVSWEELIIEANYRGFTPLTWPTDQSALVLSGIATSCSGERSFGTGPFRGHVIKASLMTGTGEVIELDSKRNLVDSNLFSDQEISELKAYQESLSKFESFKNAPFPILEKETDLITGTEGQLGVIIGAEIKLMKQTPGQFLFVKLPRWESNPEIIVNFSSWADKKRKEIKSFEFVDWNSLVHSSQMASFPENSDLVFIELDENYFEEIITELLELEYIDEHGVFEIKEKDFYAMRVAIPRGINERNSRMNVVKKGTDAQAGMQDFKFLMEKYCNFSQQGVDYCLFGHLGDRHLHFNFMPKLDQVDFTNTLLEELYTELSEREISPFAEHGIGIIKQKFLKGFLKDVHLKVFKLLKSKFDPENKMFNLGFMNMEP